MPVHSLLLDRIPSSFICPYLHDLINSGHEYLPVTRIAGMGIFLNHVDNLINHLVIDNHFQLYAWHKFHHFIHDLILLRSWPCLCRIL